MLSVAEDPSCLLEFCSPACARGACARGAKLGYRQFAQLELDTSVFALSSQHGSPARNSLLASARKYAEESSGPHPAPQISEAAKQASKLGRRSAL